ncbi:hypothetical protein OBRU01_19845 [Operophtera brumata]|uniref:Membrane magnesium transporter n=1 Tax=Operophtera brumata TaxID=104452 RepID=A0A0L7KW44_OPEBR|nr:hypothetical protein OBRU01_19845 [Operophtera brumata]
MGSSSVHKIIVTVGFISLFHTAFSAAQLIWGVLNVAGNLREIPAAAEVNMVKWETQRNLPSFYIFNHRGRALAYNYVPSSGKSDLEHLE